MIPYNGEAVPVNVHITGDGVDSSKQAWVCRACGKMYFEPGGERTARYCCATAVRCERCGADVPGKHCLLCDGCRNLRDIERWEKLEEVKWDGITPLYDDCGDKYLFDTDAIAERIDEFGEDVRLIVCVPAAMRDFDLSEYLADDLPEDQYAEDYGVDEKVINKTVNDAIAEVGKSLWQPGAKRVSAEAVRATIR